jgi:hypothetical protein
MWKKLLPMRRLALPVLLAWPIAVACGSDDADEEGGSSNAGTTSSAAGANDGGTSSAEGGAGQGGTLAEGGAGGAATTAGGEGGGAGHEGGSAGSAGSGPLAPRRVFVSSETYAGGALGGITGGDDKCQTLADAEDLGGTWLAWLSDSTTEPAARFVHSEVPYVLVGGAEIAADWDDLTDQSIAVAIDRDESGTQLAENGVLTVWTGTDAEGNQFGGHCEGWLVEGTGGVWGTATATNATWSSNSGQGCSTPSRIYCFEN